MPKSVIRKLLGMNDPLGGLDAKQIKKPKLPRSFTYRISIYTYLKVEIHTCQPNIKMVEITGTIIK